MKEHVIQIRKSYLEQKKLSDALGWMGCLSFSPVMLLSFWILGAIVIGLLRDSLHWITQEQINQFAGGWGTDILLYPVSGMLTFIICYVFYKLQKRKTNRILDTYKLKDKADIKM